MTEPTDLPPARHRRAALRSAARAARAAIDPVTRAAATAAASAHALAALADVPAGATVALYDATRDELSTADLADALVARGVATAYPVVRTDGKALGFRVADRRALVPARWRLREPGPDAAEVAADALAALIVPGLVFDRRGYRLGWGAGHYDATLPACPHARWIGIAFEQQLIDDVGPEPHDVPVHLIATEVALHRGAPWGGAARGSAACTSSS